MVELTSDLQVPCDLKSSDRRARHAAAGAIDLAFVISELGQAGLGGANEFIRLQWSGKDATGTEDQHKGSHAENNKRGCGGIKPVGDISSGNNFAALFASECIVGRIFIHFGKGGVVVAGVDENVGALLEKERGEADVNEIGRLLTDTMDA